MPKDAQTITIDGRKIDVVVLPEAAQQELMLFYEFLVFKYQGQATPLQEKKRRILSEVFQEANGTLPVNYMFNREELHER